MKLNASTLMLFVSLSFVTGCATSPEKNINARYDVSERIVPPTPLKQSSPAITVGLITLKGDYSTREHGEVLRQLLAGKLHGAASFTPPVPVDTVSYQKWAAWREVDVPIGFNVLTQGTARQVSQTTGKTAYGITFGLTRSNQPNAMILNVSAKVPTWEEVRPFPGAKMAETWSVNWAFEVRTAKGWQVLLLDRDPILTRDATNLIVAYVE